MKSFSIRLVGGMVAFAGLVHFAAGAIEPAVTVYKTPGGLTFRYTHLPAEANQVLYFAWKDGTAMRRGKEGVPTLGTSLLAEGPKGMSASEFSEEFRDLGATWSVSEFTNHVSATLAAPPGKFGAAAALLGKIFTNPALPARKLSAFRKEKIAASRQSAEEAETLVKRLFWRVTLGDTPQMRYLTELENYEPVTMADIEAWWREILVRDTLIIVAAGPMTAERIGPEIDRMFAGLPQSGSKPVLPKLAMRSPGKLIVLEKPVVQTAIGAGGPMQVAVEPDALRASAAVAVLGTDEGRLYLALRDRLGATYGAFATLTEVDAIARSLYINAEVANDAVAEAIDAIRTEYARFLAQGVTDEELDTAKTMLVTAMRENVTNSSDLAKAVLQAASNGFPDDYVASYERRVQGYTRDQINAIIAASFPTALTIVVITPSAAGLGADCVIKSPEEITRCE
jgi:zinc protease